MGDEHPQPISEDDLLPPPGMADMVWPYPATDLAVPRSGFRGAAVDMDGHPGRGGVLDAGAGVGEAGVGAEEVGDPLGLLDDQWEIGRAHV